MSDVAAETAATAVPETTTTPEPKAAEGPKTVHDRRASVREIAARHEASAATPRDEQGRFAAREEEPAAPVADATSEEAVPASDGATDQEAGEGPAEGFVRVPYPEGHPMRAQGVEFEDVPAAMESRMRALINAQDPARRSEMERLRRERQEERDRRIQLDAELRFYREHGSQLWTQDDQDKYEQIVATWGEEDAERFKRGRMLENQQLLAQVREQAISEQVVEQWQEMSEGFRGEAFQHLPLQFPGVTEGEIETALKMYGAELEQLQRRAEAAGMSAAEFTERVGLSAQDLLRVAGDYLSTRPGVLQHRGSNEAAKEAERKRIEAEVEERKQAELREAAQRHSRNPNRSLGGISTGHRTIEPDSDELDTTGMSPGQIARARKARVRALGERLDARGT